MPFLDRTQFIEQFLEWANEKGIAGGINEISIGNSEKGGLCLKARKELAAESILMRVPQGARKRVAREPQSLYESI